jgi:hypothetical protein
MQIEVSELLKVRAEIAGYDAAYEAAVAPLKSRREQLQTQITETLKAAGQFSARFEGATVTRSVRKSLKIVDEPMLVKTLKAAGLDAYVSEQVNDLWDGAAKELLKQKKTLDGTTIEEKEYLSVRTNDKDDNRKITVE